jgi:hypothetical protein
MSLFCLVHGAYQGAWVWDLLNSLKLESSAAAEPLQRIVRFHSPEGG